MAFLKSINPANGKVVGQVIISTKQDVEKAVTKAKKAFVSWKKVPVIKRVEYIKKFRKLLAKHKKELAKLTTQEMGKPIDQALGDIDFELGYVDYYIKSATKALSEKTIKNTKDALYKIVYEPWGVCASIAPWNFPVSMASSGIMQQILAGNTVVFKPSEYTTLTQKRFVEFVNKSGLPKNVLQIVFGDGKVGKLLIDADVDLVWFTGSTAVGREIYEKCGKKFIKCTMELGGSSPGIVFADCDLDNTLESLYWARFLNCGQVCSSVKRLFVEKSIYEKILEGLKEKLKQTKIGDPMKNVDFGPLVSRKQLDVLVAQVEDAKKKGAQIEIGGSKPEGKQYKNGNYYLPTILTNIKSNMRVMIEETFSPVLPIIPFESEKQAIEMANSTIYGLSAEIYTQDKKKADRVARQLDAGIIGLNTSEYYVPYCPTGGYKYSGMGREYGVEGFREVSQIKYICVAK